MSVKRRILLVDDSDSAREQIRSIIGNSDAEVLEASSGEVAHNLVLQSKTFDLAFVDVNMPGMSGLDLVEKIKLDVDAERCKRFPIIMVTTENTMDKVLRGKAAGVVGWIVKPAKPEMVGQILKKFAP